jgi:hypothetical protein
MTSVMMYGLQIYFESGSQAWRVRSYKFSGGKGVASRDFAYFSHVYAVSSGRSKRMDAL